MIEFFDWNKRLEQAMNKRLITLSLMIFAIAMFRILPHPQNVSPVAAMALIGFWIGKNTNTVRVAAGAVGASVLFFVVTNFGVWLTSALYPMTLDGLAQAYVAAIPFFQNSLLGNLVFTALLFGGYTALQRNVPALSENA